MPTYKAILFHPEGDYVTDFYGQKNISDVWNYINDMGSRWFFYPIYCVATEKTIVDTVEGLEFLKGKRISTVIDFFKRQWEANKDSICEVVNEGLPLSWVYDESYLYEGAIVTKDAVEEN